MRILIIGKNGQLGRSINKIVNKSNSSNLVTYEFIFAGREELDMCNKDNIISYFDDHDKFDTIINCAAYTAVDNAEKEQELANKVNHMAVKQLANIANEQKAKLVHISTDYVFNGESDRPYLELDVTNPINVYGKTKLAGEQALKKIMPINAVIIRTSWLYSEFGKNFVKMMIKFGKERDEIMVVGDQIGSPTYATDLANAIIHIVQNEKFKDLGWKTQVYNYSNAGEASWYDFAREIFNLVNIDCKINCVTTLQYPTLARRPKYTLMNKDKISKTFCLNIANWKDSLKSCITILK